MSDLPLDDKDVDKLARLAAVLIPGTSAMPAVSEIPSFRSLLRTAVKACGYTDRKLRAAIDAVPFDPDWDNAKAFAAESPESFDIAGVLVSAAYYMDRDVLNRLGFPVDRQHPAGHDEFVEEYETGILDPVIERGPRYRDTVRSDV